MTEQLKLKDPWLVAVWPGMGHVASSAGYYMMAKLGMHQIAEFPGYGLLDIEHVDVVKGLIQTSQRPRSRFFAWKAPEGGRDILVFIGEAQPPIGKYAFCEKLIDFARDLGAKRLFTFAAMATEMHPQAEARVFAAATDENDLAELDRPDIYMLEEGHIGGLNGIALAAAADKGMPGICLLGEIPHLFAQVPFPKASLAVLRIFSEMAKIEMDLTELNEQAAAMGKHLGEVLARIERKIHERSESHEAFGEEAYGAGGSDEQLSEEDHQRIEQLFDQATVDRSKAYLLKNELDRLQVFPQYEDRFLDLFKND